MLNGGVDHGTTWPAEFFERELRCHRTSQQYGLDISAIRTELKHMGFYLSGQGQHGARFCIVPPEKHARIITNNRRKAIELMRNDVSLGMNTNMALLDETQRRKLEGVTERQATKLALLSRTNKQLNNTTTNEH